MDRRLTRLQERILDLLYDYPTTQFNQRELAEKLKASPTAVAKALPALKESIKVEKSYPLRISLRTGFENEKRISNLRKIHDSGLATHLFESYPGCTLVLFGSYSRGEDTERSDIDIAIVGAEDDNTSLEKYERTLNRTINLQYFPDWNISGNLKESIINGIVLKGYIEL